MFLIDTDILIWALRGNKEIVDSLSALKDRSPMAISMITIAEIYKNVYPRELIKTERLINEHIKFTVTEEIAKSAGFYWQEFNKQYKGMSILDCIIAATAKSSGSILVTLNTKHFPMKDIKVLNPANKKTG